MLNLSLFIKSLLQQQEKERVQTWNMNTLCMNAAFPPQKRGKNSTNKSICTTLLHKPCDEWRQRRFLALAFQPSV